jgi:hypothetical protein
MSKEQILKAEKKLTVGLEKKRENDLPPPPVSSNASKEQIMEGKF